MIHRVWASGKIHIFYLISAFKQNYLSHSHLRNPVFLIHTVQYKSALYLKYEFYFFSDLYKLRKIKLVQQKHTYEMTRK